MNYAGKFKVGFTLIELIVVVSIMLLASSGVISGYNKFHDNQKVKQAAATVRSNLRLAQANANSGKKPTTNCSLLNGYRVTFLTNSYTISVFCKEGFSGAVTSTLPTGITLTNPVGLTITFLNLGRGVEGFSGSTTLRISGYGKTEAIIINSNGLIE